ncbi:MAG TPA: urease accessory protein UreD [Gammaproteobacteria bacterium]|nr:urease accessory protein UreD [Gammaproteobacteria bacterium]
MMAMAEKVDQTGWHGSLDIAFTRRPQKTIISRLKHRGPLRVQRPFYPEADACHVYLLHPPGGVVGNDKLELSVCVGQNSHALLTTPGSTKFYRSAGQRADVVQTLTVEKNGILEWFPQENIFFPGAQVKLQTRIALQPDANFIGWEIHCLGRPANEETFLKGGFDAALNVFRGDKPLMLDRQRVAGRRQLCASTGLRSYPMNGIFLCTSCNETHIKTAREVVERLSPAFPVGVTRLDDLLVLRVLGFQTEAMQQVMIAVWKALRPLIIHKEVVLPRIWST